MDSIGVTTATLDLNVSHTSLPNSSSNLTPIADEGAILAEENSDVTNPDGFITYHNREQIILLSILFAAIVLFNLFVLLALLIGQRRRCRLNFFIGHLAVADLLVGLLNVLPELIVRIESHFFSQYDIFCKIIRSSMVFSLILSSNVLVAMSIDRFYVIVYPMKIGNEGTRSRFMIAMAWLMTLIETIPFFFVFHLDTTQEGQTQCLLRTLQPSWLIVYVIYSCIISFAAPFLVIVACYVVIIITVTRKANAGGVQLGIYSKSQSSQGASGSSKKASLGRLVYKANNRKNPDDMEVNGSYRVGNNTSCKNRESTRLVATSGPRCNYQSSSSSDGGIRVASLNNGGSSMMASSRGVIPRAKIKTIKMTVIIVAAFVICWTPYWSYTLLNFQSKSTGTDPIWVIIQNLSPLNSAADPLIYAFFTTNLWKEFRRLKFVNAICLKCSRSQSRQQAGPSCGRGKLHMNKMTSVNTTHTINCRNSVGSVLNYSRSSCHTHSHPNRDRDSSLKNRILATQTSAQPLSVIDSVSYEHDSSKF